MIIDQAGMISASTEKRVAAMQKKALEENATPIIVVTISSLDDVGAEGLTVETLAREMFERWHIGWIERQGRNMGRGMLLLISRGEQRMRILLGTAWGAEWNHYAKTVLERQIIPEFKQRRFSTGVEHGVRTMAAMAAQDPGCFPATNWLARLDLFVGRYGIHQSPLSLLRPGLMTIVFAVGGLCFILAIYLRRRRSLLINLGLILVAGAMFNGIYIFIIVLLMIFFLCHGCLGGGSTMRPTGGKTHVSSSEFW